MTHTTWGKLTWIRTEKREGKYWYVLKCECGTVIRRQSQAVNGGLCKHCGCVKRKIDRDRRDRRILAHEEKFRKEVTKPAKS